MSAPNPLFNLAELEAAAQLVHRTAPPTPQYAWPLLAKRTGCQVWVKHENHTTDLRLFAGNSGRCHRGYPRQSRPGYRSGSAATIYVPQGNSTDQNAAIRAFGATVVEFGRDFDETLAECRRVAGEQNLHFISPFNRDVCTNCYAPSFSLTRFMFRSAWAPVSVA